MCCVDKNEIRKNHLLRQRKKLHIDDTPVHAHLPHIFDHYPNVPTIKRCLHSLFELHNETINIWTHLVGFFLFLAFGYATFQEFQADHTFSDQLALVTFFLSACICFLFSSVYHLFKCHSFDVYRVVVSMDYAGIFVMIFGSFISGLHFEFYCYDIERIAYQAGITTMCATGFMLAFLPQFDTPQFNSWRIGSYFLTIASAIIPLVRFVIEFGVDRTLKWFVLLGLYACGGFVYVTKFPESKFPGKFDLWFSSHQLWHTFVLLAAIWHYYTVTNLHSEMSNETCAL